MVDVECPTFYSAPFLYSAPYVAHCGVEAQRLMICYAKEALNKDFSTCAIVPCYGKVQLEEQERNNGANTIKLGQTEFMLIICAVSIGSVLAGLLVSYCCKRCLSKRRQSANAEGDSTACSGAANDDDDGTTVGVHDVTTNK